MEKEVQGDFKKPSKEWYRIKQLDFLNAQKIQGVFVRRKIAKDFFNGARGPFPGSENKDDLI